MLCVDNFFTGTKDNIAHLLDHPRFELMRHDVTFPLYVEVDEIYNLACPASPIHYQHDPVQTTKTSVHGAINMLGLAKRTARQDPPGLDQRGLRRSRRSIRRPESYWGNVNPIGPRACYDEGKRCAETLFFDYHRQHRLRHPGRAHLQHLRAAHASERRARGLELHRAGAAGRADHDLRRRQPDALLLLRRRPDRGLRPADGDARRRHRPGQSRQSRPSSPSTSWPRWSSTDRLGVEAACLPPAARGRSDAAPARHHAGAASGSAGSPTVPLEDGLKKTIAYFDDLLRRTN